MASRIPVSFACGGYDRMDALRLGEVKPTGVDLKFITIDNPREIFDRVMDGNEFDASEMSASEYICNHVNGSREFVAIPVFPSRAFRHGFITVDSAQVKCPKDLEGKKVGVQLYTMTAAVWIRGLLAQEGVDLGKIQWIEGAFERPGSHGAGTKQPPSKPIEVSPNTDRERGLSQLLADGDISATIGAELPSCFGKVPNIQRLFPDFKEAEKEYYRKHGIFPIMHLVVLRRTLVDQHRSIPSSLFNAFLESKELARRRMRYTGSLRYMLPWLPSELDEVDDAFAGTGGDPWPYGLEANRKTLETLVDFLYDQGMIDKKPTLEELFATV